MFYINDDIENFIKLVERLQGVYIGFAVLDFINGLPLHGDESRLPLEIVMDNMAVDELITFFADKNDSDYLITFHNDGNAVWPHALELSKWRLQRLVYNSVRVYI